MVELLKQPASSPFPVGREIVSNWAGTTGKMEDIEVGDIPRFEAELLAYVRPQYPEIMHTPATADPPSAEPAPVRGDLRMPGSASRKARYVFSSCICGV